MRLRPFVGIATSALTLAVATAPFPAGATAPLGWSTVRDVVYVGNNWDGTIQVLDRDHGYQHVKTINAIPDINQEMLAVYTDPVRLFWFTLIQQGPGQGHNQYVDDMFSTRDGKLVVASRPSFGDVVALDTTTGAIRWEFQVAGYRSDHMALSPDGRYLAVSASTANVVQVIDIATGRQVNTFTSGDVPHESNFSADGKEIYHASIGVVFTNINNSLADSLKGNRIFEIVDATGIGNGQALPVKFRISLRPYLDAAGYSDLASTIRPMAFTRDGRYFYFQLSNFHGFVEFDLQGTTTQADGTILKGRITRVAKLPAFSDQTVNDSAHHGLAIDGAQDKLCVAGTIDDYAAIVHRDSLRLTTPISKPGGKPYWATASGDGKYCYVSWSGADAISVIDFTSEKEIAFIPVGNHPQRIREGQFAG